MGIKQLYTNEYGDVSVMIVYCGWKLKTMFGNKQQHAENMDVKKIVF